MAFVIGILWIGFALIPKEGWTGMVIEQVMRDMDGKPASVITYYSGFRFRTDHLEEGLTTIIDFREDRLVMIEHSSKSYVEIKFSQWEKEVSRRLKKDSPALTPKERKIIVRKTGETAIINGFPTEKVEIIADGELIEENWVTREVEMGEMERVNEKIVRGFSKQFRSEMKEGREIYEKLKPFGFPILVKDYTMTYGLGGIHRLEVKKIEKKELKDEIFYPPTGYHHVLPKPSKK